MSSALAPGAVVVTSTVVVDGGPRALLKEEWRERGGLSGWLTASAIASLCDLDRVI